MLWSTRPADRQSVQVVVDHHRTGRKGHWLSGLAFVATTLLAIVAAAAARAAAAHVRMFGERDRVLKTSEQSANDFKRANCDRVQSMVQLAQVLSGLAVLRCVAVGDLEQ